MRKIILYMQSTLDGRGADPENAMEWATVDAGTWAVTHELTATCDTVVIGRRLYEEFLGFWPAAVTSEAVSPDARRAGTSSSRAASASRARSRARACSTSS